MGNSSRQSLTLKVKGSVSFAIASLLTALMIFFSAGFAWAAGSIQKKSAGRTAFLADKKKALAFYRIFSAAYDFLNPSFYTAKMLQEALSDIRGSNMRVLDVGCGTGYTTTGIVCREGVIEVVGLDMNSMQLGRAAKKLHYWKAKTSLSRAEAENLPFADEAFDAAISVGAIEYFPDPSRAIRELARVTKSNGAIIVGGPEQGWFRRFTLDRFFYTPSTVELEGFYAEAGLRRVQSRLIGLYTVFGTGRYVVVTSGVKAG